jgi:hypothetical protein
MPNLRCPKCYYSTSVRKDEVNGVICRSCGENLFEYYFEGKSEEESKTFILEMNEILKKKKGRDDRKKRANYQQNNASVTGSRGTFIEDIKSWIIVIIIIVVFYGSIYGPISYFQMRSGIQETAQKLLIENGINNYTADGIKLPITGMFSGTFDSKVFFKSSSGEIRLVDVEVTMKGNLLSIILPGNSEYYISIEGKEFYRLQN